MYSNNIEMNEKNIMLILREKIKPGPKISEVSSYTNQYHRNYYHKSKWSQKKMCNLCGRVTNKQKMERHKNSNICWNNRDIFQQEMFQFFGREEVEL